MRHLAGTFTLLALPLNHHRLDLSALACFINNKFRSGLHWCRCRNVPHCLYVLLSPLFSLSLTLLFLPLSFSLPVSSLQVGISSRGRALSVGPFLYLSIPFFLGGHMFYSSSRHWKKTNLLAILSSVQLPSTASPSIANLPSTMKIIALLSFTLC